MVNIDQNPIPVIEDNQVFSVRLGNISNGDILAGVSDPGNGVVDANVGSGTSLTNWQIIGPTDFIGIFNIDATTGELSVGTALVLTQVREYTLYVQVENASGEVSCVNEVKVNVSCEYGEVSNPLISGAISAAPNASTSWGSVDGAAGLPDIISTATDVVANRLSMMLVLM